MADLFSPKKHFDDKTYEIIIGDRKFISHPIFVDHKCSFVKNDHSIHSIINKMENIKLKSKSHS